MIKNKFIFRYYMNHCGKTHTLAILNVEIAISYKVLGRIPWNFTKFYNFIDNV